MSSSVSIGSSAEFSKLLSSSTVVVADFYADWCGPCKAIAPTYESLAAKHSKPNRVTFTKVNVDNQPEIAQKYGVRAQVPSPSPPRPQLTDTSMPTFMIFKSGQVINTIRGADKNSLTTAVEAAVKLAGAAAPAYSSVGRTLGGASSHRASMARPFNFKSIIDTIIGFLGLYFTSLFSFDAYAAAESSPFNIHRVTQPSVTTATGRKVEKRTGATTQAGKKLGTISDFANRD
ncbi:37S ribosomal protein rsm22 [Drepanopeziza brunnea f. sp. 'multigermtubi' MB_m1]|uniref:37S ribosomal protein rsm22 n=1 Tax=Marssonina brunnea f. sp. multigermtubi (strain MB_m1) TaxID=1072389 RepID=K1X8Z7_MARBU|nr:37S ribosomal protein rsm22 [Drepanopeziza brunnea f. sp. 'multigermtubi' MB_m1]EKD21571.1 37S ribosomal protein rsm22 [Drepanopeziza brunnea f. sp. 'multigermtubi' MB_m1]